MNNPFDWEAFNRTLREKLPDLKTNRVVPDRIDFSWIETYVQDALKQALGNPSATAKPNRDQGKKRADRHASSAVSGQDVSVHAPDREPELYTEVMEMLRFVVVKAHIPENVNPRRIRAYASPNRVRFRVLPHKKMQTVDLPHEILPEDAKAVCQNHILEIHLPKNPDPETFEEIRIRYPG